MPQGILSFTVEGSGQVRAGLAGLTTKLQDLRPFWRDVFAPKYFAIVQDLFATAGRARGGGGKFKGGAWQWLSPAYRDWKAAHYPGRPILVREGTLRESLRWSSGALGPQGVFEAFSQFVIVGTRVKYAQYHQTGTAKMPARPFLPPPDVAVFGPLLKDWILKAAKPA